MDEVVVKLTNEEAVFLSVMLNEALVQFKEQCTVKSLEDPEVKAMFHMLGIVIAQLPEVPA